MPIPSGPAERVDAIAFGIFDLENEVVGFSWLIEWTTTSFYIKFQQRSVQLAKVSLHGPDPNHLGKQHFRFDLTETKLVEKAQRAGSGWSTFGSGFPYYFTGRPINKRTVHAVRFSATADMFRPGVPIGPAPKMFEKVDIHARVPAPQPSRVVHLDVFVSTVRPYEPRITSKRIVGQEGQRWYMKNQAGMYLTAVATDRLAIKHPDPIGDTRKGAPVSDCMRTVAVTVDETQLLWIAEKLVPLDTPEVSHAASRQARGHLRHGGDRPQGQSNQG